MNISTEKGIAVGFPASDLQEHNLLIKKLILWLKRVFALGLMLGIWLFAITLYALMKYEILRLAVNRMLSVN